MLATTGYGYYVRHSARGKKSKKPENSLVIQGEISPPLPLDKAREYVQSLIPKNVTVWNAVVYTRPGDSHHVGL